MARKTVYVDDLDGSDIQEGAGGPVRFSLRDKLYEMDLSDKNIAKLEKALQPFIDKASEVEPEPVEPVRLRAARGAAPRRTRVEPSVDLDAVRAWAREKGYVVADRGRIKREIMDEYAAEKGL